MEGHGRQLALRAVDLAVTGSESGDEVMVRAGLKLLRRGLQMIEGGSGTPCRPVTAASRMAPPPLISADAGGMTRH